MVFYEKRNLLVTQKTAQMLFLQKTTVLQYLAQVLYAYSQFVMQNIQTLFFFFLKRHLKRNWHFKNCKHMAVKNIITTYTAWCHCLDTC